MSAYFQRLQKAALTAAKYKASQVHLPAGGFVILWRGKATGWSDDLSRPRYNRPGCIAISTLGVDGPIYKATGGDYWNGASEWSVIWNPAAVAATGAEADSLMEQHLK